LRLAAAQRDHAAVYFALSPDDEDDGTMRKLPFSKDLYDLLIDDREIERGTVADQQAQRMLRENRGYVTDADEELYDIVYRRQGHA
jgi:hypothetical protein